jgi:hypothetical protein
MAWQNFIKVLCKIFSLPENGSNLIQITAPNETFSTVYVPFKAKQFH